MRGGTLAACVLWLLLASPAAADPPACARADPAGWLPLEQAIWRAATAGEPFDGFAFADDLRDRVVGADFLRTLLTCTTLHAELPPTGVNLWGVVVATPIDLRFAEVPIRWVCRRCVFRAIDAEGARFARGVVFDEIVVQERVTLAHAVVADGLSLAGSNLREGLDLHALEVGRTLDLRFLDDTGAVTARDLRVGGKLRLDGATIAHLDLSSARIDDQIILSGITVAAAVVLDKVRAGSDVLIRTWSDGPTPVLGAGRARDGAAVADVAAAVLRMNNASLAGRLEIARAELRGAVSLDAVRIAEDIWLRECSIVHGPIRLPFARIGQNLDLGTTVLGDVDATGVAIGGELRLGTPGSERFTPPVWAPGSRFSLRNASAASWVDRHDGAPRNPDCPPADGEGPWPDRIDVIGFDYAGLGGLGGGTIDRRDEEWFVAWIGRQEAFSLEPYQRLAATLRTAGREAAARAVLYAGKERERREAGWWRWALLTAQKLFVGYGIDKQVVLIWVGVFTLAGWLVVRRTPQARAVHPPLDLVWSFDQLVQVVHLRPEARDLQFAGFARWYLYLHKLMGWVLGGFLLAAFAGLFGT